jgi:hypothetical protein
MQHSKRILKNLSIFWYLSTLARSVNTVPCSWGLPKCVYDAFRDVTVDSTALPLQSPGTSLSNKRHVMTGSLCGAVKYNLVL